LALMLPLKHRGGFSGPRPVSRHRRPIPARSWHNTAAYGRLEAAVLLKPFLAAATAQLLVCRLVWACPALLDHTRIDYFDQRCPICLCGGHFLRCFLGRAGV